MMAGNQARQTRYNAKFYAKIPGGRPAYERAYLLRKLYGMTVEEYDERLASQGGGCAICGAKPGRRSLPVDHDHETGLVRGILCTDCNTALGSFDDDPALLLRAIEYLMEGNDGR